MSRDLDRLKQVLWENFEKAVERQPKYEDSSSSGSSTPSNFAIAGRQSIAQLAQAIIDLDRRLEERDAHDNGIRLPGKP